MDSKRARNRIQLIIDSVRTGGSVHFLYIPNFCIAEVFSVFAKHAFGRWNPHVRNQGTIDKRVYLSLVNQFSRDIHNGRILCQYELSRYHIVGIDLVAPIDHYYQISRGPKRRHVPAGTFDHLIVSMGLHLAHIHGADKVAIVTADQRLAKIIDKCRAGLPARTVRKLKLDRAEEVTGRPFSPGIFPRCLDLVTATNPQLASELGDWPLPLGGQRSKVYRWTRL